MIKQLQHTKKLSILIPVYNFNVVDLVKKLYKQCQKLNLEFELLVFDDGSQEKYKEKNKALNGLFGVNYMEMSENLGRSKIRNWLIKSALYDYVLMLDCDAKVNNKNFIENYLIALEPNCIVNGGRIYEKKAPKAKSKYLHWLYGTKVESKSSKLRTKHPMIYFHSNNFAAERKTLTKFPFNEKIEGYGYEDLVFAQKLLDHKFKIKHIDNPVIHLGLEKNNSFIEKNLSAISNLVQLKNDGHFLNTNLEQKAFILKDWSLDKMVWKFIDKRKSAFKENLLSEKPSLLKFQLLKLHRYLTEVG